MYIKNTFKNIKRGPEFFHPHTRVGFTPGKRVKPTQMFVQCHIHSLDDSPANLPGINVFFLLTLTRTIHARVQYIPLYTPLENLYMDVTLDCHNPQGT